MNHIDLIALLVIQPIPADLYADVCAHFHCDARGCTSEQVAAYLRHELTNYDAVLRLFWVSAEDYALFKAATNRLTQTAYEAWRAEQRQRRAS